MPAFFVPSIPIRNEKVFELPRVGQVEVRLVVAVEVVHVVLQRRPVKRDGEELAEHIFLSSQSIPWQALPTVRRPPDRRQSEWVFTHSVQVVAETDVHAYTHGWLAQPLAILH